MSHVQSIGGGTATSVEVEGVPPLIRVEEVVQIPGREEGEVTMSEQRIKPTCIETNE